jgi:KDO2-lipid IV(A) lauroyltransferase
LGLRISDYFFSRDHAGRAAVMANLSNILAARDVMLPEDALRRMARDNFRMFGKYIVDFFKFSDFSDNRIRRLVGFEHGEYLEEAESRGKGVIMITAHLGNWELGGAVLSSMRGTLHAVVQPFRSNRINELFQRHREKRGMSEIPLGSAARGVIKALRGRGRVAMLADRDYTARNESISFFGKPARLPSGPARIACKTGSPIVPAFLLRQPDDTFLMRFHPPVIPGDAGCVDDVRRAIRDVLEREIAANPLQWFMFDNFWN